MWKLACIGFVVACSRREPAPTQASGGADPVAPGIEDRLARVERKLDKVIAALEPVLPPAPPSPGTRVAIPVGALDPVEGRADAKVTVVQVIELPCQGCVQPGQQYRLVTKYLALGGQPSVEAGLLACAANRQGKFRIAVAEPRAEALAKAGADAARLELDKVGCQRWLLDSREALRAIGVRQLPACFVDGLAVPCSEVAATVAQELALPSIPPPTPIKGRFDD